MANEIWGHCDPTGRFGSRSEELDRLERMQDALKMLMAEFQIAAGRSAPRLVSVKGLAQWNYERIQRLKRDESPVRPT
jgi:hypothetical protein